MKSKFLGCGIENYSIFKTVFILNLPLDALTKVVVRVEHELNKVRREILS